jgi:hypothetical protein
MQNLPITTAEGVEILCEFRYVQDAEERYSDIPLPPFLCLFGTGSSAGPNLTL